MHPRGCGPWGAHSPHPRGIRVSLGGGLGEVGGGMEEGEVSEFRHRTGICARWGGGRGGGGVEVGLDPGGGGALRTLVSPQLRSAPLAGCTKGRRGSRCSRNLGSQRSTLGLRGDLQGGRALSLRGRPPFHRPHPHRWLCLPPACSGLLGAKGCHGSQSGPGALGFLCWFRGLLTCSNFLTQQICGCASLQGINTEVGTHSESPHT